MDRLTTLKAVKKVLGRGVLAAAVIAALALQARGVAAQVQLWSIVIHFQYADGFEFDYVLERGVPADEVGAALAECGRSHSAGSVVRSHCYAVPE